MVVSIMLNYPPPLQWRTAGIHSLLMAMTFLRLVHDTQYLLSNAVGVLLIGD